MMHPRITEDNFPEMLGDYAKWKYGDRVYDYYDACPYDLDFDSDDLVYKQIMTWLAYEKKDSSGRSLIDELVDNFVDDHRLGLKILHAQDLVHDTFFIQRSADHNKRMRVQALSSGKTFEVEVFGRHPENYVAGASFSGMIHPWYDDGTYRTTGIAKLMIDRKEPGGNLVPPLVTPDMFWKKFAQDFQKKAESITISAMPMARTLLRQFPAEWVDGICDSLDMDSRDTKKRKVERIASALTSPDSLERIVGCLSGSEKTALMHVLKKDGCAKYSDLCRRAGADDTKWWWDKRPTSAVGVLRRHGLLVVGKKRIMTRTYKVAAIPADVAVVLRRFL